MKKKNIIIYGIIIVLALVSIVGITYGWQDVIRVVFHKEHLMGTVTETKLYDTGEFSDLNFDVINKQYVKIQLDKLYKNETTTLEIRTERDEHIYYTGDRVMVVFNKEDNPKLVSVVWLWYGIVGFAILILAIIITFITFLKSNNPTLPPNTYIKIGE